MFSAMALRLCDGICVNLRYLRDSCDGRCCDVICAHLCDLWSAMVRRLCTSALKRDVLASLR